KINLYDLEPNNIPINRFSFYIIFFFNFALKMKMFEGNEAWSNDTFYFDYTLQSQSCRIEPANIPLKDNPFPSTCLL
ncbi:hypothetical protein ES319_A03G230300v1, partial [Gossypium barbadense]